MSLLTVVQGVCAGVGVTVPSTIVAGVSNDRTKQEMLSLANEMAQRIAYDTRDWTLFRSTQTMTGNGTKTAFDMPADFKRMLLTANVWRSSSTLAPMSFVPDTDEWLNRRSRNYYNAYGEWTILGGQMLIAPAMGAGVTAYYAYMSKNCIALTSGGYANEFMADTDTFRLDERLLKLAMIWQWKANKGTSYAEDMGTYGDALSVAMGHDSPAPIMIGRKPMSANAKVAYPFQVPT